MKETKTNNKYMKKEGSKTNDWAFYNVKYDNSDYDSTEYDSVTYKPSHYYEYKTTNVPDVSVNIDEKKKTIDIRSFNKSIVEDLKKALKGRFEEFYYCEEDVPPLHHTELTIFPKPIIKEIDTVTDIMAGMPNNCYKYKNLKDDSPFCANCPFFAKCARMTKQDKEMVWLTKKVIGYAKVSEKTFQELVQAIFTVLSQYRSVQIYKS